MAALLSVRKELIRGVVYLARHKEFYGHIVQQLQKVFTGEDHRVDTAAVGRIPGERFLKMYLSEKFFGDIFEEHGKEKGWEYMLGVLEHEILHIVFGHLFLHFHDMQRGHVAVDLVVNSYVNRDKLPGNYCHPDTYNMPEGKSAMWYYTHLQSNPQYQQQCKSGQFGAGGIMSHIMSSHGMWSDVKDDLVSKEFAKDIVRKSKDLCNGKNYGDIPGDVIAQIDETLRREKAIVPWAKVLRMFVASAAESVLDYTIKRKSRRFGTRPGTRKGDVLKLCVAIDTSGSISDEQLKLFWNEIRWIYKNGVQVWVMECDTRLSERSPFKFKGKWDGKCCGRGGTDIEPPLKAAERKYDALIYFTDFYAPEVKTRYKIPVLWVLTTEMEKDEYPYKWGKHIKIEEGKAVAA